MDCILGQIEDQPGTSPFILDSLIPFRKIGGKKEFPMAKFPSNEWTSAVIEKLYSDEDYARIARNWEDDLKFIVDPGGSLPAQVDLDFDLWHSQCRNAMFLSGSNVQQTASFVLKGPCVSPGCIRCR